MKLCRRALLAWLPIWKLPCSNAAGSIRPVAGEEHPYAFKDVETLVRDFFYKLREFQRVEGLTLENWLDDLG